MIETINRTDLFRIRWFDDGTNTTEEFITKNRQEARLKYCYLTQIFNRVVMDLIVRINDVEAVTLL